MKRNNKTLAKIKRGFTLVELVIVIAVIAILAAVLIPTFITVIDNANNSADVQLVANMNTILSTDFDIKENATAENLRKVLNENGLAGTDLATKNDDMLIVYNQKTNKFERMNLKKTLDAGDIVIANAADGSSYFAVNPYAPEEIFTDCIIVSTGGNALSEALYKLHNIANKAAVAENADILKSVDKGIRDKLQPIINSTLYVGKNAEGEAAEMFRMAMSDEGKLSVSDATSKTIDRVVFHEECTELDLQEFAEKTKDANVLVVLPETLETASAEDEVPCGDAVQFVGNTEIIEDKVQKEKIQQDSLSGMRDAFAELENNKAVAEAEEIKELANYSAFYLVGTAAEATELNYSTSLVELIDSVKKAQTLNKNSITITLKYNGYTLTSDITIPANVTLLLPYDSAQDATRGVGGEGTKNPTPGFNGTTQSGQYQQSVRGNTGFCDLTVNVDQGVTITNLGTLNIGGITSGGNGLSSNPSSTTTAKYAGQTASGYARLVLGDNAKIVSSGAITSLGFIEEKTKDNNSEVILEKNGSIKMPFIVREHRGGNAFLNMVGGIMGAFNPDPSSNLKTSPFNRFLMENVHPKLTVFYGAKVLGQANLHTGKPNQDNQTDITLIGNNDVSLIKLEENAKAIAKFDSGTAVTDLEIKGSMSLNSLSLEIDAMIAKFNMRTKAVFFPLSWYYHVTLSPFEDGKPAIVNATAQKIKLLPGASLTVGENVTMNASELVVYQGGVFSGIYDSGGDYEKNTEATFTVNGTLIANKLAGTVLTTGSNANLEVKGEVTIATQEVSSSSSSSVSYKDITTTLTLAGVETPQTGTYVSEGGTWQKQS